MGGMAFCDPSSSLLRGAAVGSESGWYGSGWAGRADVSEAVRASSEFTNVCPASAVLLALPHTETDPEREHATGDHLAPAPLVEVPVLIGLVHVALHLQRKYFGAAVEVGGPAGAGDVCATEIRSPLSNPSRG